MRSHVYIIMAFASLTLIMNCRKSEATWTIPDNYLKDRIIKNSRNAGLDPVFIAAIIKAESNFNKYAFSKSHARGYMQLKPRAAYDSLCHLKYTNLAKAVMLDNKLLYETDINIMAGTGYLKWIIDRKLSGKGDWIKLISYYNSGQPDEVVGSYVIKIKRYYEENSGKDIEEVLK